MNIKRNSAEFKAIKELFEDLPTPLARRRRIKLYARQKEKFVVIKTGDPYGKVGYDLTYAAIMDYLRDRNKKLYRDDGGDTYYFKSGASSSYKEFPFKLKVKPGEK